MTPDELKALVEEATPGPWELSGTEEGISGPKFTSHWDYYLSSSDARLAVLAPRLALLCAEMGRELQTLEWWWNAHIGRQECPSCSALKSEGRHKTDCALRASLAALEALERP